MNVKPKKRKKIPNQGLQMNRYRKYQINQNQILK